MSKSLNLCCFIGRLGSALEVRTTTNGHTVGTVNIALNSTYTKRTGTGKKMVETKVENTDWIRLVFWNKLAEVAAKFLVKGSLVNVTCRVSSRSYDDKGVTKYITEFVVENMVMLGDPAHNRVPAPVSEFGGTDGEMTVGEANDPVF